MVMAFPLAHTTATSVGGTAFIALVYEWGEVGGLSRPDVSLCVEMPCDNAAYH